MKILFTYDDLSPNFYYETHLDIDHSVWLEGKLFVNDLNIEYAKKHYKGQVLHISELPNYIEGVDLEVPFAEITAKSFMFLKKYASSLTDNTEYYLKKRMIKSHKECDNIKKAHQYSLSLLQYMSGDTELELYYNLKSQVALIKKELAFNPIVANLSNARFPHYKKPSKAKLNGYLVDFGIKENYYVSDITESKPITPSQKNIYDKLIKAYDYIVDKIYTGMLGKEVDELYKKVYKKLSLPLMPHLIGHGIGLEVHEYPRLHEYSEDVLKRVAIAIEPAYYGETFGLRYERNILISSRTVKDLK